MQRFTVEPEALRRAAYVVDAAADHAGASTSLTPTRNLGHARLSAAAEELLQSLTGGWTEATAQIDAVAASLRATAQIYERADTEDERDARAIGAQR